MERSERTTCKRFINPSERSPFFAIDCFPIYYMLVICCTTTRVIILALLHGRLVCVCVCVTLYCKKLIFERTSNNLQLIKHSLPNASDLRQHERSCVMCKMFSLTAILLVVDGLPWRASVHIDIVIISFISRNDLTLSESLMQFFSDFLQSVIHLMQSYVDVSHQ